MENDEVTPNKFNPIILSILVITVIGVPLLLGIDKVNRVVNDYPRKYLEKTTPSILQQVNAESRNDWAKQCLRLSNNTRTPDECTAAAFRLYPEKDWVGIAKNNEVIYKDYSSAK